MTPRYLAGQITCRECGHVELLIRNIEKRWRRVRRCACCDSRWADVPVWWPVEDVKAIVAVMSTEIDRAAKVFINQRRMN